MDTKIDWYGDQREILADVGYSEFKPCDPVENPSHYTQDDGIECIEAIRAALGKDGFIAFCRGNSIKYLWRLLDKHEGSTDAKKAKKYIEWLIEEIENVETP